MKQMIKQFLIFLTPTGSNIPLQWGYLLHGIEVAIFLLMSYALAVAFEVKKTGTHDCELTDYNQAGNCFE